MKKLFLFAGMFFILTTFTNAQNAVTSKSLPNDMNGVDAATTPNRCGTIEHLQWMLQQDPTLIAKMDLEEKKLDDYIVTHQQELENDKTNYVIPCVVHIVYNGSAQNISDARVIEQITQTNKDWGGTNGRSMGVFSTTLRANTGISLCLAKKDPNGNTTTGITRTSTTTTEFNHTDNNVKHTSIGGCDAWNPSKYFNIWVCNLTSGLAGYAEFPTSGLTSTYGVVICYKYFGITGATSPFNGGGTLSHEGGHCFNLIHIWGDENGCTGTDNCADTPNQAAATTGNHSGVLTDACTSTSPGIMYMNFMDYSDDADYANMTPNQATRMKAAITSYLMSVVNAGATECGVGIGVEGSSANNIQVYPNPVNDVLNIDLVNCGKNNVNVEIFNSIGGLIKSVENKSMSPMMKINLADVKSGIYYIIIKTESGSLSKKITIMK